MPTQHPATATHNRDIVPSLPPHFAGFHHAAVELYTWSDRAIPGLVLGRLCDESGEDPECYDGACGIDGYGMCTSFEDHLHYLGVDLTDSCDPDEDVRRMTRGGRHGESRDGGGGEGRRRRAEARRRL